MAEQGIKGFCVYLGFFVWLVVFGFFVGFVGFFVCFLGRFLFGFFELFNGLAFLDP